MTRAARKKNTIALLCGWASDIEAIAPYDGDPIMLARVERFWFVIHKVPATLGST